MGVIVGEKKMLSKKDQLYKNKAPKITQHERSYLEWLQHLYVGCFHCGGHNMIEWHHIKERSTDKKNHTALLPLCKECHTGNKFSPHGTPRKWREVYPIEVQNIAGSIIYGKFQDENIV